MLFISYSSIEKNKCDKVIEYIKSEGHKVWLAPDDVPAGKDYADVIPDAIRKCDAFIVLLTEKSQASKWVPKELDQAITAGKTIVPFHMDESAYTDSFEFRLSNVQRIEAAGRMDEALAELGEVLKKIKDGTYEHLKKGSSVYTLGDRADAASKGKNADGEKGGAARRFKPQVAVPVICAVIGLVIVLIVLITKDGKSSNENDYGTDATDRVSEESKGEATEDKSSSITGQSAGKQDSDETAGTDDINKSENQQDVSPADEETGKTAYTFIGLGDSEFDREKAYECALAEYEDNKYNQYLSFYMSDMIAAGGITDLGKQARMSNVLRGLAGAYAETVDIELKDGYVTTDTGLCTGDIVYAKCTDCGRNVRV